MSQWVRLWEDMPTDPKWRIIAKRSGRPACEVIALFTMMMTNAGGADPRGSLTSWDDEAAAMVLDMDEQHVAAIREAMQGRVLDGDKLLGWEKRQPKREDASSDRVKAFRERQADVKRDVTHGNARAEIETHGNAPEEKREEKRREEKKERSLRSLGASAPDPEADAELERTYRALQAVEQRKPNRPKVRSTISEDAQPSERDASAAREASLSDNDFRTQWRQFRDHHRAKGSLMSDWSAAWRTWIGNINKFAGTGPPNTRFGTRNGKPSISDFVRAYDDRINATDAADRGVQGGEIRALPGRQLQAF